MTPGSCPTRGSWIYTAYLRWEKIACGRIGGKSLFVLLDPAQTEQHHTLHSADYYAPTDSTDCVLSVQQYTGFRYEYMYSL